VHPIVAAAAAPERGAATPLASPAPPEPAPIAVATAQPAAQPPLATGVAPAPERETAELPAAPALPAPPPVAVAAIGTVGSDERKSPEPPVPPTTAAVPQPDQAVGQAKPGTVDAAAGKTAAQAASDAAVADALAHFDFDRAELTAAGRAALDTWLAQAPKNQPVRVIGHADRLGPEPYNLKLSLRRAQSVRQYLTGKGVSARVIELEAKGESEPVKRCKGGATPATKKCLAPNRRAVVELE